jgi:protein-tyrosine phosphatase
MSYYYRRIQNKLYNTLASIAYSLGIANCLFCTPLRLLQNSKKTEQIKILFVCQGNICRSCYAAIKLESLLSQSDFIISSAGLITTPGKAANSTAIEIATSRNIDLTTHSTTAISSLNLVDFDLIFTMEPWQQAELFKINRSLKGRVMLLGALSVNAGYDIVIRDPFGKPTEFFENCFNQIDTALLELSKLLSSR